MAALLLGTVLTGEARPLEGERRLLDGERLARDGERRCVVFLCCGGERLWDCERWYMTELLLVGERAWRVTCFSGGMLPSGRMLSEEWRYSCR